MKAVFKNSTGLDMFEAAQLAKNQTLFSPRDAHHGYDAEEEEEETPRPIAKRADEKPKSKKSRRLPELQFKAWRKLLQRYAPF